MNKQIIGIFLVRNEERFFNQVIANTIGFCDRLIIADNRSTDDTPEIARRWAERNPRVSLHTVDHPAQAHALVKEYFNTPTWMFAVDGDEIYDPDGLARFRKDLLAGRHDEGWLLLGNVLNCIEIDTAARVARGYLAPPCRSMTKLYNFGAIRDWTGVETERMLGGTINFKPGWNESCRIKIHEHYSWEDSPYRCLHACFLPRSRQDQRGTNGLVSRWNPVELQTRGLKRAFLRVAKRLIGRAPSSTWKQDKYMRGALVSKDVTSFFRSEGPRPQ